MDKFLSGLSFFDLIAITLSGALLLAGIYWGVEGVPRHAPGAAAAFGFAAASYVAGQLMAGIAARLWRRETHPWKRELDRVLDERPTYGGLSNRGVGTSLATAIRDTDDLPATARVELIRAWLRQRGLDGRFELMNTMAWVSRTLTTTCIVLVPFFVVASVALARPRPLFGALVAAGAAVVFAMRTRGYQAAAVQTLVYEVLAHARPPSSLALRSSPDTEEGAAGR